MNDKIIERKRIRGSNFTPEEELELIQNIVNYQHIIESKELNSSTRNEKDAAWAQIGQIFNSKFCPRTVHQLRSKYDNMKTIARRLVSDKRNNVISINTYSANSSNIRANIAMNIVLSIINKKHDNSLDNIISCNPEDVQFSEESSSFSDNSSKPVPPVNEFDVKVKEENNYYEKPEISIHKTLNNTLIINTPAEINKNIEKHKNLVLPPVISPQPNEDSQEKLESTNPVVPKRRNPRVQELLKAKTEYLKRRLEFIEIENEERIKRMKREEELYAMKMKILELDVRIKEEELKKLQNCK